MPFLNFIHKPKNELEKGGRTAALVQEDASEPEKTCPNCHKSIPLSRLWSNWNTCACGYHFRMGGRQRLRFLADKGSFQELFSQVEGRDPLSFPGYREKLDGWYERLLESRDGEIREAAMAMVLNRCRQTAQ